MSELLILNTSAYLLQNAVLKTDTAEVSSYSYTQDLGAAVKIDHVLLEDVFYPLRRATPSGANSLSVTILADDNALFSSPETVTFNIGLTDLQGVTKKDICRAIEFTTAYQHYKITLAKLTGSNIKFKTNCGFVGKSLDIAFCPDYPIKFEYLDNNSERFNRRNFTLYYSGLSEDTRVEIFEYERYNLNKVVGIYDNSDQATILLNNERFCRCILKDVKYSYRTEGIFDCALTFEEVY